MHDERLLRRTIGLIIEVRKKALYKQMIAKYLNIPRYVLHDIYLGYDDKWIAQLNRLDWKLIILTVNPGSFSPETQRMFSERNFGEKNPYLVPRDEERMKTQKTIVATSNGNNEPIIVIKRTDGYQLEEGWHRTMNILLQGKNGDEPKMWDLDKIKALVGSFKKL